MIPVIPVLVVLAVGGYAWKKRAKHPHGKQKRIYEEALASLKDPVKLRALADAFEKEGYLEEATLLRKRAALRELPPEVQEKRKEAFRKGMTLKNPAKVLLLAKEFEKQGATGAAAALRKYAAGLKAA